MLVVSFHRRETQLGAHEELLAATELFDLPYYGRFFGRVVYAANIGAKAWGVCIFGYRDQDLDVVGRRATFELRSSLRMMPI